MLGLLLMLVTAAWLVKQASSDKTNPWYMPAACLIEALIIIILLLEKL